MALARSLLLLNWLLAPCLPQESTYMSYIKGFTVRAVAALCCLFLFGHGSAFAAEIPADAPVPVRDNYGIRPETPEEQAAFLAGAVVITDIHYNALALERLAEAAALGGQEAMLALSQKEPVPFGNEISGIRGASAIEVMESDNNEPQFFSESALPSAIDNSQLPAFPPIRSQGRLGSCAAFSTIYYQATHMIGMARGWDQSGAQNSNDYRFAPNWGYNMLNHGRDGGSSTGENITMISDHGVPTWSQWPYSSDYLKWSTDPNLWRSALNNRIGSRGVLNNFHTPEGMYRLKQLLVNGYVLNMSTHVSSWQRARINDDPSTSADDAFVGQYILLQQTGYEGGHAMTIVGYNDDIWLDINGNGVVDPGERGALKIANSWGTSDWNGGFRWLAYDAIHADSQVTGWTQSSTRTPAISRILWVTPRVSYTPLLLVEFDVSHPLRRQMAVSLDRTDVDQAEPSAPRYLTALRWRGGDFNFKGTTSTSAEDIRGTFVLDYHGDHGPIAGPQRYWFGFNDQRAEGSGVIHAVRLRDGEGNVLAEADPGGFPIVVDDTTEWIYIDYNWVLDEDLPEVTIATVGDGIAYEVGEEPAYLRVSRSGSTDEDLEVEFTVSGTATWGVDYVPIGPTVVIPAGACSADIAVTPMRDTIDDDNETVVVTLANASGYQVSEPMTASVTIRETNNPLIITTSDLVEARVGVPYHMQLEALGGTLPLSWSTYPVYHESDAGEDAVGGGTAQGWHAYNDSWQYVMPWSFPFFGSTYDRIHISCNGLIDFIAPNAQFNNSEETLQSLTAIAPLWDNFLTRGDGSDIFITVVSGDSQSDDAVIIRTRGETSANNPRLPVEFECVLYRDGRIAFRYAIDMENLTPTIGISGGTADSLCLASIDGATSISAGTRILFSPHTGPAWLTLSEEGVLSGLPSEAGTASVSVLALDATPIHPQRAVRTWNLVIVEDTDMRRVISMGLIEGHTWEMLPGPVSAEPDHSDGGNAVFDPVSTTVDQILRPVLVEDG